MIYIKIYENITYIYIYSENYLFVFELSNVVMSNKNKEPQNTGPVLSSNYHKYL